MKPDAYPDVKTRERWMTISHFSSLCGVPRQTLIYYDRMGIFCPAVTASNGYRYYQMQQLEAMECILALRELDMPLLEIKKYLDSRQPENCLQLLEGQLHAIQEKIERLKRLEKTVAFRIDLTAEGVAAIAKGPHRVTMVDKDEFSYLAITSRGNTEEDAYRDMMKLSELAASYQKSARETFGAVICREDVISGNCQKIHQYFIPIGPECNFPEKLVRPAGLFAVIHHKGPYESSEATYNVLKAHLHEVGYVITGDSFETGIHDCFTVQSSEDYLTMIEVPVRKK